MKYVALLRGINVGGSTVIKMEALREVFESLGFKNVKSYIQSGNIVFESTRASEENLARKIEIAVESKFFKAPVLVRSREAIENVIANNPFAETDFDEKQLHVVFLKDKLTAENAEILLSNNNENETFAVIDREIYCRLRRGVADSLLGKRYIETKLKATATARNWRTVNKIRELFTAK